MHLIAFGLVALCAAILSGVVGPRLPAWGRHQHHRRGAAMVHTVAEDRGGALRVSTRGGASHVQLGAGPHGLEVWSDDRGNTRVNLGGALKVTTDEHGRGQVRLGGLAVDTHGSD